MSIVVLTFEVLVLEEDVPAIEAENYLEKSGKVIWNMGSSTRLLEPDEARDLEHEWGIVINESEIRKL